MLGGRCTVAEIDAASGIRTHGPVETSSMSTAASALLPAAVVAVAVVVGGVVVLWVLWRACLMEKVDMHTEYGYKAAKQEEGEVEVRSRPCLLLRLILLAQVLVVVLLSKGCEVRSTQTNTEMGPEEVGTVMMEEE